MCGSAEGNGISGGTGGLHGLQCRPQVIEQHAGIGTEKFGIRFQTVDDGGRQDISSFPSFDCAQDNFPPTLTLPRKGGKGGGDVWKT